MINGRNYKVSTRASTLRAAMEQLKCFEADPENYNPAGLPHEQPIYTWTHRSRKSSCCGAGT